MILTLPNDTFPLDIFNDEVEVDFVPPPPSIHIFNSQQLAGISVKVKEETLALCNDMLNKGITLQHMVSYAPVLMTDSVPLLVQPKSFPNILSTNPI